MKVTVRSPFYHTDLGLIKRGEADLPADLAKDLISQGAAVEVINEREPNGKSAAKGKGRAASRDKRV